MADSEYDEEVDSDATVNCCTVDCTVDSTPSSPPPEEEDNASRERRILALEKWERLVKIYYTCACITNLKKTLFTPPVNLVFFY